MLKELVSTFLRALAWQAGKDTHRLMKEGARQILQAPNKKRVKANDR